MAMGPVSDWFIHSLEGVRDGATFVPQGQLLGMFPEIFGYGLWQTSVCFSYDLPVFWEGYYLTYTILVIL